MGMIPSDGSMAFCDGPGSIALAGCGEHTRHMAQDRDGGSAAVAILTIGDELTSGRVTNTNAAWIASRLREAGLETVLHVTCRDVLEEIVACLGFCHGQAEMVITTGGLGPTTDDITHEAVAAYAGVEQVLDEHEVQVLRGRFESMGMPMPDSNLRQAMIPVGARVLPNEQGTAPGIALQAGGGWIVTLPGVPREMKPMMTQEVIPLLRERYGIRGVMKIRVLKTFGYTESRLANLLADVELPDPGLRIGYRPRFPEIHISITASAPDEATADAWIADCEKVLAGKLGKRLWGTDDDDLASVVLDLMRTGGHTLATAESCTGGLVSKLVTDIAGSSDVFERGLVTYTNEAKMQLLGVPPAVFGQDGPGAVSEQCVLAMARGAIEHSTASHALAISGIAGPGGGTGDRPVGTVWIALATPEGDTARRYRIPGPRRWVRTLSAHIALERLRRHLLALEDEERWVEK